MNKYEICIEPKEYHTPKFCPSIDDECEQLIDCILDKNDVYFSDIAHEIADNAIHIYYPDLLKVLESGALSEYIGRAINEFDLRPEDDDGFNFIMKTIQWGECLYYDEQLQENFKTIIQNTIITYLDKIVVYSEKDYDSVELEDFCESYINNIDFDENDKLNLVIDNFKSALTSKFDIEIKQLRTVFYK